MRCVPRRARVSAPRVRHCLVRGRRSCRPAQSRETPLARSLSPASATRAARLRSLIDRTRRRSSLPLAGIGEKILRRVRPDSCPSRSSDFAHIRCFSRPMSVRSPVSFLQMLRRLPARAVLGLIRLYQVTLSPALPILTLGRCGCRFAPTCSHYAAEAVRTHGALTGLRLALVRLAKCTPLHPGGIDLVPSRRVPHCVRAGSSPSRLSPVA